MIRTRLGQEYIKRSCRPIYGWDQATPKGAVLDPAWDRAVDIYPGMGMTRAGGDLVTVPDGAGDLPYGLSAHFVGGYDIDEPLDVGLNVFGVWVLGPDAEFEIDAPAFDSDLTWTDPTNGTGLLIHVKISGATRGCLVPAGTANATTAPIARLLKVKSDSTIVIGGLVGTSA